MVMFDITDQNSFVNVQIWLGRIRTYCKQGVSVLLVGNKSDLGVNRDIEARAAEELADREGLCYKEMSARNLESVNDAVTTLAKMVKEQNRDFLQMAATKNFPVPAKEKDQCCSLS